MSELGRFFSTDGPLAASLPGYAPRQPQIEMAEAIMAALQERDQLVVEAGTGTGKTFAYLVPALLSGQRIIISTGTRNLQDQLYRRDLPAVAAATGKPVETALLKGRANYLCRHRLTLARSQGGHNSQSRVLEGIAVWDRMTADGDIAGINDVPEDSPLWPRITSTIDNCLGQDCPELARCHVLRARRAAQSAGIVIVNHHLLLADLALKEDGFGELLPAADAVIVDEAHQLADIAVQFFGSSFSQGQLEGLLRDVEAEALRDLERDALMKLRDAAQRAVREARLTFGAAGQRRAWRSSDGAASVALALLLESMAELTAGLATREEEPGMVQCRRRCEDMQERLGFLLQASSADGVRWIETSQRRFSLHLTPVETGENLRTAMQARPGAWVFTSATLAVGEDFDHFLTRTGVQSARTLQLESPFDFSRNARLYLPQGLPEPGTPDYTLAVVEVAIDVIEASAGRAFLLFTSHRALAQAHELLLQRNLPYPLLVQGEAPRDELLRRFRAAGNAVLLGTSSFWEGVDVRGEALSVVLIDKLPFAAPTDPVLQARLERIRLAGGNPFHEEQLPVAVLGLKQGAGRLIRDVKDRGVLVLCDPRLRSKSYGKVFLRSLPVLPQLSDSAGIRAFLQATDDTRQVL